MSSKEKLNNHLVSNIDNTDENVKFVKDITVYKPDPEKLDFKYAAAVVKANYV